MPMFSQSLRWVSKFMSAWISLETNTQQRRLFRAPGIKDPATCRARHQFSLVLASLSHHTLKSLQRTENYFNSTQMYHPIIYSTKIPTTLLQGQGISEGKKVSSPQTPSLKSWHWVWNQCTVGWISGLRPLQSQGQDNFFMHTLHIAVYGYSGIRI
jgi:hypothetical protein